MINPVNQFDADALAALQADLSERCVRAMKDYPGLNRNWIVNALQAVVADVQMGRLRP